MIVDYKTILYGDIFEDNHIISQFSKPTDVFKYVVLRTEFCCEKMLKNWGEVVGFGELEGNPIRKNTSVNMYYHEGYGIKAVPIKVCPFCGEEIQITEKEVTKLEKFIITIKGNQVCHREVKVK